MKKHNTISLRSQLSKDATKIKISKKLNDIDTSDFIKKKMEKGAKTLAIAGIPK
ncbi:MAG: hypothetical protein WDM90_06575 [Ferruginibacter sp.]